MRHTQRSENQVGREPPLAATEKKIQASSRAICNAREQRQVGTRWIQREDTAGTRH